jgi:hypothetical protein
MGDEGLAGHGTVEYYLRGQAIAPQRSDEGCGIPMTERRVGQQAPAPRCATIEPGLNRNGFSMLVSIKRSRQVVPVDSDEPDAGVGQE